MITVGNHPATLYHGDSHPAEWHGTWDWKTEGKNRLKLRKNNAQGSDHGLNWKYDSDAQILKIQGISNSDCAYVLFFAKWGGGGIWDRHPSVGETYTYTVKGLAPGMYSQITYLNTNGNYTVLCFTDTESVTFTVPDNVVNVDDIQVSCYAGTHEIDTEIKVQLELGTVATPYEPYTGGKPGIFKMPYKFAGFKTPLLEGKGRVGWEAPYKAALPSVTVKGKGEQERLKGTNCIQPNRERDAYGVSVKYEEDGTLVLNGISNFNGGNGTNYVFAVIDIPIDVGQKTLFKVEIVSGVAKLKDPGALTYAWSIFSSDQSKYVRKSTNATDFENTAIIFPMFSSPQSYQVMLQLWNDGCMFDNFRVRITIAKSDDENIAWEPYCGGIPAPNPEYPIEPKFLEGAKVQTRGKNLADSTKLIKTNNNIYSYDKLHGFEGFLFKKGITYTYTVVSSVNPQGIYINHYDSKKTLYNKYNFNTLTYTPKENMLVSFDVYWAGGRPDDAEIQIELGSTPTPYEPYFDGGSADIPILRALPDGSVRDEIDLTTGTVTRRIGEHIYDGKEPGAAFFQLQYANTNIYRVPHLGTSDDRNAIHVLSNSYQMASYNTRKNHCCYEILDGVDITDSEFESLEVARNILSMRYESGNPVKIWYALKTPVIEHVSPALLRQHPGYTQLIQQGGFKDTDISVTPYLEDK